MITITGGVISKQNGSTVTYQFKCSKCDHIDSSQTTITLTKGVTEVSTHKCPNCSITQIIKMKIVDDEKVRVKEPI